MRFILTIALFLFFVGASLGQTFSVSDSRAIKLYQEGEELVKKRLYSESIEKYMAAVQRAPGFVEAYLQWARLSHTLGKSEQALSVIDLGVSKLSPSSLSFKADFSWLKVHCLLALGEFDRAIEDFGVANTLLSDAFKKRPDYLEILSRMEFLKKAMERSFDITKEKLESPLNGFVLQYFPVLTADSRKILFTRREGLQDTQNEDIFMALWNEQEEVWDIPVSISENINSSFNEGTSSISADGNILIFTSCDAPDSFGSCDLYISYRIQGEWQKPANMGKHINSRSWDSQPSLSADGRVLFFSSNRRGGFGGNDIWYSVRGKDGAWSEAKNLGDVINTPKDEVSPFIYFNNEVLFFASDGHQGFGGKDIFVSRVRNGVFEKPENIGFPINDQNDQFSLFISAQRDYAYYTESVYSQGKVEGAYLYRFRFPEEIALGEKIVVTQGKVLNSVTGQPMDARLSLVSLSNDSTLYEFGADGRTGEFMMLYPDRELMGLYVEKPGFLPRIYNVDRDSLQYKKDLIVSLLPLASGEEFVFENVFFDFDKADLKPESLSSLRRLYDFLVQNPSVNIKIVGHTDNVGSAAYNHNLSLRRAESVRSYLVSRGLHPERALPEGRGDREPVRPNNSAENRALNRRITIVVQ